MKTIKIFLQQNLNSLMWSLKVLCCLLVFHPLIGDASKFEKRAPSPQSTVTYRLCHCPIEKDKQLCAQLEASANRVAKILSGHLHFPAGLYIDIYVDESEFSNNSSQDTIASTNPTGYNGVVTADRNFFYPQAAVRQIYHPKLPEFLKVKDSDMVITINPLMKSQFWFPAEERKSKKDPKRSEKLDVDYILLHETIHGLGFMSFFGLYLEDVDYSNTLVTPPIRFRPHVHMTSLSIFDKFIFLPKMKKSLFDLYQMLLPLTKKGNLEGTEWITKLKSQHQDVYDTFKESTRLMQVPGEVVLIFPQYERQKSGWQPIVGVKQTLPLYVDTQGFITGSSLTHLANSTTPDSEDFILAPFYPKGLTLEELTQKYGSPIGRKIMSLLVAMGYQPGPDARL